MPDPKLAMQIAAINTAVFLFVGLLLAEIFGWAILFRIKTRWLSILFLVLASVGVIVWFQLVRESSVTSIFDGRTVPGTIAGFFFFWALWRMEWKRRRRAKKKIEQYTSDDPDNELFQMALEEYESPDRDQALYARLFTANEGNNNKTKAAYIGIRVEELQEKTSSEQDTTRRGGVLLVIALIVVVAVIFFAYN